jgi:hypothetical protein
MNLLEIFFEDIEAAAIIGEGAERRPLAGFYSVKGLIDMLQQLFVLQVPGSANKDILSAISIFQIGQKMITGNIPYRVPGAENGMPERMVFPESLAEQFVDLIVRRVIHHMNFLEDDTPFLLYFVRIQNGVKDDVGEEIDRQRESSGQHFGIIAAELATGECIEHPADRIDLLGDFLRISASGPLEEHVLNKVGNAALGEILMARTVFHPEAEGDGMGRGNFLRYNANTIFKDRFINHSSALFTLHSGRV